MKKSIYLLLVLVLSSCVRDFFCDCKKTSGCKIIKFLNPNDSTIVLETKVFCPFTYIQYDTTYLSEVKKMKVKYDTVDTAFSRRIIVKLRDSVTKRDSVFGIRANDTKRYYDSFYRCTCKD
jgi:hypothetical protein